jgi:transglutaminase-like putative cysteine protease
MPVFTVHHTTTYLYRQPVGFGEHRLMLRPLESPDQRMVAADLRINPEPASLHWEQDEFRNWVGRARFRGRARSLCFHATISVEQTPWRPGDPRQGSRRPATPDIPDASEFQSLTRRRHEDSDAAVADWARSFLVAGDTLAVMTAMNQAINKGFGYVRREEKGIQHPALTLSMRAGSCRDYAVLMIEAARALDIPARFVSGYLHLPKRQPGMQGGGSTHAWVQAWLPETGWADFDPTNGVVGNENLIRVAAAPDPAQVLPLSGTFIGFAADQLGMDVSVRVESGEVSAVQETCGVVA